MKHAEQDHLVDNLYFERQFNMRAAKIFPGKYFVTPHDILIVTVLGSCVSVCLRDPMAKIGGMNHFMLPEHGGDPESQFSPSARYGAFAMEVLINHLLKLGASRQKLEAKVFGAARVLSGMSDIGSRNARFAMEYLERENIPVIASDLGDIYPRKVYFFPSSGRVMVRQLRNLHADAMVSERAYGRKLDLEQVGGDVDLFG